MSKASSTSLTAPQGKGNPHLSSTPAVSHYINLTLAYIPRQISLVYFRISFHIELQSF
ncbi:MAG: hypothetical protein ACTS4V_01900 [Candidatus Hodgkinia cicadicola]